MDVRGYLTILSKKQGWFTLRNDLDDRLNALATISEIGHESHIWELFPHLKDNNREIQIATCNTISRLFAKINTQNHYYTSVKHCGISKSDIDLFHDIFEKDQFLDLLLIASLNANGHIRESAVKKLSEYDSGKTIQFIIYRLGDWVPEVRRAALRAVENFKSTVHLDALVNHLSHFEWLRKVERVDLSAEYESIIRYISVEQRGYVHENFHSFSEKNRLLLARHLSNSSLADADDVRLFLSDTNFLIRLLAIDHFEDLSREDVKNLLRDKSSKIRLKILYRLQDQGDSIKLVSPYLTDSSASIRQFARHFLRNEVIDFATIYSDKLKIGCDLIGSLMGLAEVGGNQFSDTVASYLNDKKIKVIKTAFMALTKLDVRRAHDFALVNLDCEYSGIRNVAARFLQKRATAEVFERVRDIYANGRVGLKKEMLKMFIRIGGWPVIPDILIGTVEENREIRDLALTYLDMWKAKAARLFVRPKPNELERAKDTFKFAFELHQEKQFLDANPLQGFDFYLQ